MTEAWVFGTDPSCDVVVDCRYASPRHARVSLDGQGRVWVEDLGSTNGTWLSPIGVPWTGGMRVYHRTQICPGVLLWVGTRMPIPWSRR